MFASHRPLDEDENLRRSARWASDPLTRELVSRLIAGSCTSRDAINGIKIPDQHETLKGGSYETVVGSSYMTESDAVDGDDDAITFGEEPTEPQASTSSSGGAITTKDFLRPVFRWMKARNQHYNPDKAFEFAHWVVTLRCVLFCSRFM
jgi:hypothetical protein